MLILIADNSASIIDRIKHMISDGNDEAVIYTADNYDTALSLFEKYYPSVVLLGLHLPGKGSLKLLQVMKEKRCETKVIILSIHISSYDMEQCKLLGVHIFLDKFLEFEKIPGIINALEFIT